VKLSDLGEHQLIARVTGDCAVDDTRVVQGIGDDCSMTRLADGLLQVVTTDMLVENVHFVRDAGTPHQLGAKSLAVNLSDIAAMGATPRDAWVSVALPETLELEWVDHLFAGIKQMAREHSVNLLGGDTTRGALVVVNIVVVGEVSDAEVLLRSGARAADRVFVTGALGDAAAGLDALGSNRDAPELIRRHHEPQPHVQLGRRIATSSHAHAAIDVSDGLSSDLNHVCDQSNLGCLVDSSRLPLSEELRAYCAQHNLDALTFALTGGEDYVLLVTGDPALSEIPGLVDIGEMVSGNSREIIRDGERSPLEPRGWDHLRR